MVILQHLGSTSRRCRWSARGIRVIKMKKNHYVIISTLMLLTAGIIANQPKQKEGYRSVSWAYGYGSIEDLSNHADLIVKGYVTKSIYYHVQLNENHDMLFTNHTLKITEYLQGETIQKEITIVQTGGIENNKIDHIKDDPLLQKNMHMIVFLRQIDDDAYCILGGPQGRFIIQNNKVYSVGEIYSDASVTTKKLHTEGIQEKSFIDNIN